MGLNDRDYMRRGNQDFGRNVLLLDVGVLEQLKSFMLAIVVGVLANYAYYEFFSLHYLFVRGVQDWFNGVELLLENGISDGYRYNALYVVLNGFYYAYLARTAIGTATAIFYSQRPFYNGSLVVCLFSIMFYLELSPNISIPSIHSQATLPDEPMVAEDRDSEKSIEREPAL